MSICGANVSIPAQPCILPPQHTGHHADSTGRTWAQTCTATSPALLGGDQLACDLPNHHQLPHHDPSGATWGPIKGGRHAAIPRCERPIHKRYPEIGDPPWSCTRQQGHPGPHAGYPVTQHQPRHRADPWWVTPGIPVPPPVLVHSDPPKRRWGRKVKQDTMGQLIPEAMWQAAVADPTATLPPPEPDHCDARGIGTDGSPLTCTLTPGHDSTHLAPGERPWAGGVTKAMDPTRWAALDITHSDEAREATHTGTCNATNGRGQHCERPTCHPGLHQQGVDYWASSHQPLASELRMGEGRSNLQSSERVDPPPGKFSGRIWSFRLAPAHLRVIALICGLLWVIVGVTLALLALSGLSIADAISVGGSVAAVIALVTAPIWVSDPEPLREIDSDSGLDSGAR